MWGCDELMCTDFCEMISKGVASKNVTSGAWRELQEVRLMTYSKTSSIRLVEHVINLTSDSSVGTICLLTSFKPVPSAY